MLKLLVEGESYKSAATELGIAFHTVAFSRTQLLSESRALEIRGRGQGAGVSAYTSSDCCSACGNDKTERAPASCGLSKTEEKKEIRLIRTPRILHLSSLVLALVSLTPAQVTDESQSGSEKLEGTWFTQVSIRDCTTGAVLRTFPSL